MIKVYLAGRIQEDNVTEAMKWRLEAVKALASYGMIALNPLDGFVELNDSGDYIRLPFVTDRLIFYRYVEMLEEANAIILNTKDLVEGLDSMFEIGYAYAHGLPIYVLHEEAIMLPFVIEAATKLYETAVFDLIAKDINLDIGVTNYL